MIDYVKNKPGVRKKEKNKDVDMQIAAEGVDEEHGADSDDGLQRILKRPKVGPWTFLPEEDVPNMHDGFDAMSPQEIILCKNKHGMEYVLKCPPCTPK